MLYRTEQGMVTLSLFQALWRATFSFPSVLSSGFQEKGSRELDPHTLPRPDCTLWLCLQLLSGESGIASL